MVFWLIIVTIAFCVTAILVVATRMDESDSNIRDDVDSDIAVYKDQLSEVGRDLARGVLNETEAEQVRLEVSRRLLDADKREKKTEAPRSGGTRLALAIVPVIVLLGGGGLYFGMGNPRYGDLPIKARLDALEIARASRMNQTDAEELARENLPRPDDVSEDFVALMEKLRAAIEARPDDIQGLTLLAQNEARLGKYAEARVAQERLVEAKGENATIADYIRLVDVMVFAAAGYVSPEAEVVLQGILGQAPDIGAAQYYLGLVEAQNGRADRAFPIWRRLLENSPPDAPWVPVIRSEISAVAAAAGVQYRPPEVRGPTGADIAAAEDMTADERQDMIRGMVAGLERRLASEGGSAQDWARLITALGVLGEKEHAAEIANEARVVFADDGAALGLIENARSQAGISN
ncbi:MAG: c-type cytochrome biogenesis protein CcmI [Boseongicola sp.]